MSTSEEIQNTLVAMGFVQSYIQRACKVYEKNYGTDFNLEVITEIIVRLQNKDKTKLQRRQTIQNNDHSNTRPPLISKPAFTPFKPHMTLSEASALSIGDLIDHRDDCGRFLHAKITQKNNTKLKIHYVGLGLKEDIWTNYKTQLHKFAAVRTISQRPAHRFEHLKKGDFVDINPVYTSHLGWKCGEIHLKELGQIQVNYQIENRNHFYWTHLDNTDEIASFTTKSSHGTVPSVQVNVENTTVNEEKQKADKEYDDPFASLMSDNLTSNHSIASFPLSQSKSFPLSQPKTVKHQTQPSTSSSKKARPLQESETISVNVEEMFNIEQNTADPWSDLKVEQTHTTQPCPFGNELWDNEFDGSVRAYKDESPSPSNNPFLDETEEKEIHNDSYLAHLEHQIQLETLNEQIKLQQQSLIELQKKNDALQTENVKLKRSMKILSADENEINKLNLDQLKQLEERMESSLKHVQMTREILFEDTHLCIVCKDNVKNVIMDGCEHFVLCSECAQQLDPKMCPICRNPYKTVTQLVI